MNVSEIAVTNMANLAFFMVNFSQKILQRFRRDCVNDFSLLDLKAFYRGFRYVDKLIKLLPQKPEPFLMSRILHRVANIGAIHPISLSNIFPE
jgi:putative transposase